MIKYILDYYKLTWYLAPETTSRFGAIKLIQNQCVCLINTDHSQVWEKLIEFYKEPILEKLYRSFNDK